MQKIVDKIKQLNPKKRNVAIVCIMLVIILILVVAQLFSNPQRSVAAYCETFRQEKVRLAKLPGDTWPTGVFNEELNDAGEIAVSFSKLEEVALNEIRPDVATLQSIYQKIDSDPSRAISTSLSGVSAEENVKKWTKSHCSESLRQSFGSLGANTIESKEHALETVVKRTSEGSSAHIVLK